MTRPDYYGNPAGLTGDADIVRAIYGAFARRDMEAALPFFAEDCELNLRGTGQAAGRADPYVGHAGVRQYFRDAEAVWEELVLHADDYRVMPGIVIVIGHVTLRRAGVGARRSVVWTWRLRDGKATSVKVADAGEFRDPAAGP